jgi:hypothetical protein
MLGTVTNSALTPHGSYSLIDRHGLSLFYWAALALPILSMIAGALSIRRAYPLLDRQALSRSCYRMSLGVLVLYVVLALPSHVATHVTGAPGGSNHTGPQVLLGGGLVLGWYLLGGFFIGRFVARQPRVVSVFEPAHAAHPTHATHAVPGPTGEPDELAHIPARRRRRVLTPVTIGVACMVLLAAAVAGGVIKHGGKNAPDALSTSIPIQPVGSGGGPGGTTFGGGGISGDPSAEDDEAQQTLQDLASAEQTSRTRTAPSPATTPSSPTSSRKT